MWTDNYKHEKYIGLTAHTNFFKNDEFILEKFVFYVDVLNDFFITADALTKKIYDVFAEYGISKSDVIDKIIFTTDRGRNIKSALNPPFKRIFCATHYISNIVGHMCNTKDVAPIVKKAAK